MTVSDAVQLNVNDTDRNFIQSSHSHDVWFCNSLTVEW